MKEKPDVLSDDKIDEAWPSETEAKLPRTASELPQFVEEIRRCARIVAEDQRDADVIWFNSEYPIKYREEADEVGHFIDRGWIPPEQYKINIQQAKTEVAREIFEKIEKRYSYPGDCGVGIDCIVSDEWQSFKASCIGGQK